MKPIQRLVGTVGLIVIGISPTRSQQVPPLPSSLLQRATKLDDASNWVDPLYLWQGPHMLLTFRGDNRTSSVTGFVQVDTRTGSSQPLTQLNQQWKKYLATMLDRHPRCIVYAYLSPDGKWLYVCTKYTFVYKPHEMQIITGTPDGDVLFAVEVAPEQWTGKARIGQHIPDQVPSLSFWARDSRSWICVSDGVPSEALLTSPDQVHPISGAQSVPPSAHFQREQRGDVGGLGITEDGRLLAFLIAGSVEDNPRRVNLVSLGLTARATPPRVMPLSLPIDRMFKSVSLSPDGKRLVWLLSHYTRQQVAGNPAQTVTYMIDRNELWISRADGTEMERLGWVALVEDRKWQIDQCPQAVEWMPDSQHISFVYKNCLYSIPAHWSGDAI